MKTFTVLRRVDAFVDYTVEIKANTAEEAVEKASEEPEDLKWELDGTTQFNNRHFYALDDRGRPIEETHKELY